MKALVFERRLARFAASRVASAIAGSGHGVGVGPLELLEIDPPELPGNGWVRVQPRLAGICGSDLATLDGRSSRYFEHLVSFPFVPGHEVVGDVTGGRFDGQRVVVEPVLGCEARGLAPPCQACASGDRGRCERIAFGELAAGLQTGYCTDTGGGWSGGLVAHESQLHVVPEHLSDEAAVMIEPTACAVHAACSSAVVASGQRVVVLGAGTLGLCTIAALRAYALPGALVAVAKHPDQRNLARQLGADHVVEPDEVVRAARRLTGSLALASDAGSVQRVTGGVDAVFDCVGSAESLESSLSIVRPGGEIVLVGMPGPIRVDLAPLWQREVRLRGAYAYGTEQTPAGPRRTFDLAADLVHDRGLERLVSARYPLERYEEAIAHAARAGARGAVKIVFDMRRRPRPGRQPSAEATDKETP
ncbi:MAG: zinc-dependent alcohol dehydrogenase [Acidimicrobiales bacterium]